MEPNQNPLETALDFAMKSQQAQFNAAKLIIRWTMYGHEFCVESLNPISAFELMEKVKIVAKDRLEEKSDARSKKPVKK